jgi:hypothetical protein
MGYILGVQLILSPWTKLIVSQLIVHLRTKFLDLGNGQMSVGKQDS